MDGDLGRDKVLGGWSVPLWRCAGFRQKNDRSHPSFGPTQRGSPRTGGWSNDPLFEHSFDMLLHFISLVAADTVWAEADGWMVSTLCSINDVLSRSSGLMANIMAMGGCCCQNCGFV